jgi:glycosyltransferase EpsF
MAFICKPVRVLHAISNMKREGAQTFIMNVYHKIDRQKVQFDFLVNTTEKCSYDDEIKEMGGKIIYIPKPNKLNILSYSSIVSKIIKKGKDYTCVHSHSLFFNGVIMKSAYKAGVPVRISHGHSTNDGKKDSFYRRFYINYMRKNILKYSTGLFGCSEKACEYLYGKGCFNDERVKVISNGIELDKYKDLEENKNNLKEKLGLPLDCILIGNVARFTKVKNHKFLICIFSELLKKNPKIKLILVGDGPLKKEIKKFIEEKGVEKYVYLLGIRNDVPELMSIFDVFLLPSLYEGVPLVLIEAQAAGIPCIVSDTISKDVDMGISLLEFLDLKDDIDIWVNTIMSKLKTKRLQWNIREEALKANGYDIKDTAINLQKVYLRQYK